jgi:hypothetical protein
MRIYYEIILNSFDKSKTATILEPKQNYFFTQNAVRFDCFSDKARQLRAE